MSIDIENLDKACLLYEYLVSSIPDLKLFFFMQQYEFWVHIVLRHWGGKSNGHHRPSPSINLKWDEMI